jgi:hypothetical protein
VLLLGGGSATAGTTAVAPANTVTGTSVVNGSLYQSDVNSSVVDFFRTPKANSVWTSALNANVVTEDKLSPGVRTKLNKVGTGTQGPRGEKGEKGEPGPPGTDAIVSVTALSNLTNRPDSGLHGDWAVDTFVRNVAITKQGAAPASNCGAGATSCFFYTGSMTDSGTFVTKDGAPSPLNGTAIKDNNSGTMSGGAKLEFYATSDAPDDSLVQGNVDGPGVDLKETTTARWVAQFFPAGVAVTDAKLNDWKWTYLVPSTCESHSQSNSGNEGDILGVSICK